jgi:hypothetical protein
MLQNYADSEAYYKSVNGTTPAVAVNFAFANSTASAIKLLHIPGTFTNVTILANATTKPEFSIYSGNNCGNTIGVPTMELQTIATECSLFPCARTYTAAVINGNVVETEIKQSFRTNPWLTDQESFRKGLIPENIQIDTNEHSTSRTLRSNGTSSPCTYTTGARFIIALSNFFWGFWNATVSGYTYGDASSDSDILDVLYAGGVTNFTYVNHVLGGIADFMIAAIRLTGDVYTMDVGAEGGQGRVIGQVMEADTSIDVRWGWIVLPCALAFFTVLLLISTVVMGRAPPSPAA